MNNDISVSKNQNLRQGIIQFIKFGLVGGLNTGISYGITNASFYLFGLNEHLSNFIAWTITVFISFLLNSRFVFAQSKNEKQSFWKSLIKVYAAYSVTGVFLTFFLTVMEENILGIPHCFAQLINIPITVPINFLLNKFWAYKSANSTQQTSKSGI